VIGVVTLLIGATTALAELKDSLDQIWNVPPQVTSGLRYLIHKRLLAIGIILFLAFLLLVSLAFSPVVSALARVWGLHNKTGLLLQTLSFLFSFALVTLLFALIYKVLPSVRLAWRDVIVGAITTAILFSVGKLLIGIYLGHSDVTSTYGAAGSVIFVLLWVYYSAQIFLFGAEFTKVYAHRYGSKRGLPSLPTHA
jgi:membrane protein